MSHFQSLRFVLLATLAWTCLSCKSLQSQGSKIQNDTTPTKARNVLPEVSFYRPFSLADANAVSEADLLKKVSDLGVDLTGQTWKTIMLGKETPERLLFIIKGSELMPVASLEGSTLHPWSQSAEARATAEGAITMNTNNIFYRHASMGEYDTSDDEIYLMYHNKDDSYDAIAMTSHALTSDGILRRRANQFLDENGMDKFGFKPIRENVWQIQGNFSNGILCEGALFWREGDIYYHAVKQYGLTKTFSWRTDGDVLRLDSEEEKSLPDEASLLKECPGKSREYVQKIISDLKYDPESKVASKAAPITLERHTKYPLGTKVIADNAIFVVLYMTTEQISTGSAGVGAPGGVADVNTYYLTNVTRTNQEDRGQPYTRIYTYKYDKLEEIAKTSDFLIALSKNVNDISTARIQASKDVATDQERGRWFLKNAEVKANQVDTWQKLAVAGATAYAWDLTNRAFSSNKTSVMGIKNSVTGKGMTMGRAALSDPELKKRMLASFYLTISAGVTSSAWTTAVTWDTRTPKQQWDNFTAATVQAGVVNGMRSFFLSGKLKWVTIGVSGFAMRWRKLETDKIIGYDNGNTLQQALNLTAGTATTIISSIAQIKGGSSGQVGAINQVGGLLADIIAGRGTPGLILGSSLEIGVNLFVKDPLYRPYAIVASRMISSIILSLEAQSEIEQVGRRIDAAIALRYKQIERRDTLLWLLKTNPNSLDNLGIEGRNFAVATVIDPYAVMKQYYLGK